MTQVGKHKRLDVLCNEVGAETGCFNVRSDTQLDLVWATATPLARPLPRSPHMNTPASVASSQLT